MRNIMQPDFRHIEDVNKVSKETTKVRFSTLKSGSLL